jgi:hypothetical protein
VLIHGYQQHVLQYSLEKRGLPDLTAPITIFPIDQIIINISFLNYYKFIIIIIIIINITGFILVLEYNPFTLCPQVRLDLPVADNR